MRTYPSSNLKRYIVLAVLALAPLLADAHPFHGNAAGLTAGLSHPLFGPDHILAMVAVGIWASQLGGKSLWVVPASFVGAMIAGGAMAMAGLHLPVVEAGVIVSVLTLGVMIAAAIRLPLAASITLIGLFALCHGLAHGAEIPAAASGFAYAVGFAVATAALHAVGIAFGTIAHNRSSAPVIRWAGAAVALTGFWLWLG